MKIEHCAYQVEDPVSVAAWYVEHLGLRVKRAQPQRPFGHFLADDGDAVMLEIYNHPKASLPDYRQMDPLLLHIAFRTDDVAGTRERLVKAGAVAVGEIQTNDVGDELAMLRDPWGFAIQLVRRSVDMI
jgi:catechol 2,3-dioxygenase-like lactoylglutathione lyase family enzyme